MRSSPGRSPDGPPSIVRSRLRPGWIHPDRAPGRHRDHRRADRPAAARGAGRARGGPADPVHQQPEADRPGAAQLPPDATTASRRGPWPYFLNGNVNSTTFYNNHGPSAHARMLPYLEQAVALQRPELLDVSIFNDPVGDRDELDRHVTTVISDVPLPVEHRRRAGTSRAATRSSPTFKAPGNSYFASVGSTLEFAAQQTGGPPNGPFPYVGTKGRVTEHRRRHRRDEQHDRLRRVEDRQRAARHARRSRTSSSSGASPRGPRGTTAR